MIPGHKRSSIGQILSEPTANSSLSPSFDPLPGQYEAGLARARVAICQVREAG
jgi:hypothetical protein